MERFLHNRAVALGFRVVLVVATVIGVLMNVRSPAGGIASQAFAYYTIQSNLLVIAFFGALAVRTALDWRRLGWRGRTCPWPQVRGAVTLAILVTMLVYQVVLVPIVRATPGHTWVPYSLRDNLVHLTSAVMCVLDWLLFTDKRGYRWWGPFAWLGVPAAYLLFAMLRAAVGPPLSLPSGAVARYPYGFIDVDKLGWAGVATNVAVMSAAFLVVGFVLVGLDRIRVRRRG